MKNTRLLPDVAVVDRVPLMVCWAAKLIVVKPAEDGAVTAKLLNVFVPVIDCEEPAEFVNEKL